MSDFEMLALFLNTAVSVAFVVEYTDEDLAWFRKPLNEEHSDDLRTFVFNCELQTLDALPR